MNKLRVGIIGAGGIAEHAHIPGLKECENARITAICDIDPARLQLIGDSLNLDASHRFSDAAALIACDDVDAVEICTPNYLHMPMALAAAKAGKFLSIEKPLALCAEDARELTQVLAERGRDAMVCFSYRFRPAVRYAKHLIDQGILGRLLGMNVVYLKDSGLWPNRTMEWRFQAKYAGTGVLGDLGAHLVDMARFLAGDFASICGRADIIVPERPLPDGSGMGRVETDDCCNFLAEMACGATANFSITRCAYGHRNTIRFELYGEKGALSFHLDRPDILDIGCAALFPDHPELHEVAVPDGFVATQEQTFVNYALGMRDPYFPSLADGVACQRVLDALKRSSVERHWIAL